MHRARISTGAQMLKTVGVVEALNERIAMTEEENSKIRTELGVMKTRNATRTAGKGARVITGIVCLGFALLCVCAGINAGDDGACVLTLGLVSGGGGMYALTREGPGSDDTTELARRLAEGERRIEQLKAEKRELLLSHEREIKADTAPMEPSVDLPEPDDEKECPQCAETVKSKAKICRFCRHEFA